MCKCKNCLKQGSRNLKEKMTCYTHDCGEGRSRRESDVQTLQNCQIDGDDDCEGIT